jgi:hypothetical protein
MENREKIASYPTVSRRGNFFARPTKQSAAASAAFFISWNWTAPNELRKLGKQP